LGGLAILEMLLVSQLTYNDAIETLFPYILLYNSKAIDGRKKMIYLNPAKELNFPGSTTN